MLLMWWYISMMSSMLIVNRSTFFGIFPLKASSSVGDSGVMPIKCMIGSFIPGEHAETICLVAVGPTFVGKFSTAGIRFSAFSAMQAPSAAQSPAPSTLSRTSSSSSTMHLAARFSSR